MYQYPYPQRPGNVGPSPFSQPPGPVAPPPPPQGPASTSLYSAASGSVSVLRLKPAEEIRIEPPVPVSAALVPSTSQAAPVALDLGLERQLVEAATTSHVQAFLAGAEADFKLDPTVKQLVGTGLTPAAAALGAAYSKAVRGGQDKAAAFATNCGDLTGMGFSLAAAAGALVKHSNNLEAATDSCLSLSS